MFEWAGVDAVTGRCRSRRRCRRRGVALNIGGAPLTVERARRVSLRRFGPRRDPPDVHDRAGGRRWRSTSGCMIVPLGDLGAAAPRGRAAAESDAARRRRASSASDAPAGWTVEPAQAPFALEGARRARRRCSFTVTPARATAAGAYELTAEAVSTAGRIARRCAVDRLSAHPDASPLRRRRWRRCASSISKVAPVRVGYVMGSGDRCPTRSAAGARRHARRRRAARRRRSLALRHHRRRRARVGEPAGVRRRTTAACCSIVARWRHADRAVSADRLRRRATSRRFRPAGQHRA